jgi:NADH:ubiquinone oxidoreductase subunit 3 (subunit A)
MFAQASDQVYQACNQAQNCPAEYSDLLRQYLIVGALALVAVGLVAGMLSLSRVLRPEPRTGRYQGQKLTTYESGVDPVGTGWSQSNVRYYVFAVLFVLFDVEAVFIFPWAMRLEAYGVFGLVEMLIFIAILVLGLVYAWRKKVLQWL